MLALIYIHAQCKQLLLRLQVAAPEIAMIKMVVPRVAQEVIDNAIQVNQSVCSHS